MKFKPKHALAALAIAVAGPASAQVISQLPSTGNSSVYFTALDAEAGRSYFTEMLANAGSTTTGVLRLDDLVSNPTGSWTITLSDLSSFASGSPSLDNLFGGFGASDINNAVGGGTTAATGNRRVLMSTATGGAAPTFTNTAISSASTNYQNYLLAIPGECPSSPCIATTPSAAAYAGGMSGLGLTWGFPSGSSIGDAFTGSIAWDIYLAATSSSSGFQQSNVTLLALSAVLNLATNTLTISGAPPSDVPVPAAVWLLGSAMLGFMGIGRRKKGQAGELANGAVAA